MATVTANPASNSQIAGTWTNPSNTYALDGSLATVSPGANTTAILELGTYGFDSSLPSALTITKVEFIVRANASGNDIGYFKPEMLIDGIPICETYLRSQAPSQQLTSSATTYTFDITDAQTSWTRAKLLNASLKVRIAAINGVSAGTFSFDSVQVKVTYDPAGTGAATGYSRGYAQRETTSGAVPRYQVEIRKGGLPDHFDLLAVVDDFESVRFVERYWAPGEVQLVLGDEHPLIDDLTERRRVIRVLRDGKETFSGVTMHRAARFGSGGKGQFVWTLTGPDMSAIFRRRSLLLPSGQDTYDVTGTPGSVISSLITTNYIQGGGVTGTRGTTVTNTTDAQMGFVTSRGVSGSWSFSNQFLGDVIYEVARAGDVGIRFRLDPVSGQAVVNVVYGADRTYPNGLGGGVYLTLDSDNLLDLEYEDNGLDVVNRVFVGGLGVGQNRVRVTVDDSDSQDDWGIQEGYLDYRIGGASNTSTSPLSNAGKAYIAKRITSEGVRFTIQDTAGLRYKTHWDVGDIITVNIPRLSAVIDLRVIEVATTLTKNQPPVIEVTLGSSKPSLGAKLQDIKQSIAAATQSIPEQYPVTKEQAASGKTTLSDGDYDYSVRTGAIGIAKDSLSGLVRVGVRDSSGWKMGINPIGADWANTAVVSGAGKSSVSDGDFTVTPIDGATAVVHDTSTGKAYLSTRVNGSWITDDTPLNADYANTKVISGAGKTTASDGDFTIAPVDGTVAVIKDTTSGLIRYAARVGGVWINNFRPANADYANTKVLSGAGKTTAADGDFSATPLEGTLAVVHDTSTGTTQLALKTAGGVWKYATFT